MPIIQLSSEVINKIAAGEVFQTSVHAIKELIENSLDAKATEIVIIFEGNNLFQVSDNGSGIEKADFPLLCQRYCTSKLNSINDFLTLCTFGFRGEALASLSYASRVAVTSRVKTEPIGYTGKFLNGRLIGDAIPIAANVGTQIIAEDLFYNMPSRQKCLKSTSQQYQKIISLIHSYSMFYNFVKFMVKKSRASMPDYVSAPSSDTVDIIGQIYGPSLSSELIKIEDANQIISTNCEIYCTNANFHSSQSVFQTFVNGKMSVIFNLIAIGRLVELHKLKKAIDALFSVYLPKGSNYFFLMKLYIEPVHIDVNVHPTKNLIAFKDESQVIRWISEKVKDRLNSVTFTRNFPVASKVDISRVPSETTAIYDHKKIRLDSQTLTLENFVSNRNEDLKSLVTCGNLDMLKSFASTALNGGSPMMCLSDAQFVGVVDETFSLLQIGTKLYIVNDYIVKYNSLLSKIITYTEDLLDIAVVELDEKLDYQTARFPILCVEVEQGYIVKFPNFWHHFLPKKDQIFSFMQAIKNPFSSHSQSLNDRLFEEFFKLHSAIDSQTFYRYHFNLVKRSAQIPYDSLTELTNLETIYKIFERC